jgi:hypothetical protein
MGFGDEKKQDKWFAMLRLVYGKYSDLHAEWSGDTRCSRPLSFPKRK